MKIVIQLAKYTFFLLSLFVLAGMNSACRKNQLITDSGAKVTFSTDSVLFDTVFTSSGSATRNFRIRNPHDQKIKISAIELEGGKNSSFIINVDGISGASFSDIELDAGDSMYVFVQVNINPGNVNSPFIVSDALKFSVNGNEQKVVLEAWGQDAWYHKATNAIQFSDGTYLPYSRISSNDLCDTVWKKDKPHVIYGYLVVDSLQKLTIEAGVQIYLNYKAGLWVYRYGQLKVLGEKGNEVVFQGARREKEYLGTSGQWDRIWINEGSDNNEINYAIIKDGYIGIQTEILGNVIGGPGKLKLTNTQVYNMSLWGLYGFGYKIYAGNNVFGNCKECAVNIALGGDYQFRHCTFANFWTDDVRTKTCINMSNYTSSGQILPISAYFGNCIIDGKLSEEITLDLKGIDTIKTVNFSNSYLKTEAAVTNTVYYTNVKKGPSLKYNDVAKWKYWPDPADTLIKNFDNNKARADVLLFPDDITGKFRTRPKITAGAYEF